MRFHEAGSGAQSPKRPRTAVVVKLTVLPVAVALVATACTGGSETSQQSEVSDPSTTNAGSTPNSPAATSAAPTSGDSEIVSETSSDLVPLPVREGPRRETTYSVPHIQINAEPLPDVDAELRRRMFSLPGVEDRESALSLPGARSLWLSSETTLLRPDVLQSGREFAHIHPNGSLHIWLPVDRAHEVATTKWGELHPWVGRDDFWDGMAMLYTPETMEDVDITMRIIVDAYNFVTGEDLDPADFP